MLWCVECEENQNVMICISCKPRFNSASDQTPYQMLNLRIGIVLWKRRAHFEFDASNPFQKSWESYLMLNVEMHHEHMFSKISNILRFNISFVVFACIFSELGLHDLDFITFCFHLYCTRCSNSFGNRVGL